MPASARRGGPPGFGSGGRARAAAGAASRCLFCIRILRRCCARSWRAEVRSLGLMRAAMACARGWTRRSGSRRTICFAVEYIKALRVSGAQIEPYTVARRGVGHDAGAAAGDYQSATFCRELIQSGVTVRRICRRRLREIAAPRMDRRARPSPSAGWSGRCWRRWRLPPAALTMYPDVTEGLEKTGLRTRFAANVPCGTCTARLKQAVHARPYTAHSAARLSGPVCAGRPAGVYPPAWTAEGRGRILRYRCARSAVVVRPARDAAALPDAEREKLAFETLLTDI